MGWRRCFAECLKNCLGIFGFVFGKKFFAIVTVICHMNNKVAPDLEPDWSIACYWIESLEVGSIIIRFPTRSRVHRWSSRPCYTWLMGTSNKDRSCWTQLRWTPSRPCSRVCSDEGRLSVGTSMWIRWLTASAWSWCWSCSLMQSGSAVGSEGLRLSSNACHLESNQCRSLHCSTYAWLKLPQLHCWKIDFQRRCWLLRRTFLSASQFQRGGSCRHTHLQWTIPQFSSLLRSVQRRASYLQLRSVILEKG